MCNSSSSHGNYSVSILVEQGWTTGGWTDFKLPSMNEKFNEKTANLTLEGKFNADPDWCGKDVGRYPDDPDLDYNDSVQGTIRFTFKDALDTYHSDVLDTNKYHDADVTSNRRVWK
jgi:hypothetical protein